MTFYFLRNCFKLALSACLFNITRNSWYICKLSVHYNCTFILCCCFFFITQDIIDFPGTWEFPGNWCSGIGIPGKNKTATGHIPSLLSTVYSMNASNTAVCMHICVHLQFLACLYFRYYLYWQNIVIFKWIIENWTLKKRLPKKYKKSSVFHIIIVKIGLSK